MRSPADAPILTSSAMRAAEKACEAGGVSLAELMERAGAAIADTAWRMAAGGPILVLCGPGNNGGDGYVAARLLAARGADVSVAALTEPKTDLARAARASWDGPVHPLGAIKTSASLIVDALFGAGLTRPLGDDLAGLLRGFSGNRVLAVDLPSGVDTDGVEGWQAPLCADVTVALGAIKPAHVLLPSARACGHILLAPIGIERGAAWRTLPRRAAPTGDPADHKYRRGMVLVAAGDMKGAARLTAGAALRAGAGYVILGGCDNPPFASIIAEAGDRIGERLRDPRLGAAVIGPGHGAGGALTSLLEEALRSDVRLVLDAAAIEAALPLLGAKRRTLLLTPHEGEFAKAFPGGEGSKIERTLCAARAAQAIVIHKGADTIIAAPDGRVVAAWPGSPWLATAGTGDVLAGACGAMLAVHADPFDAAVAAVGWQIDQARAIGAGLVADDLIGK